MFIQNPLIQLILENRVMRTDSYKFSHWLQYPPNTTHVSSYIESRGLSSEVEGVWDDEIVFFGIQGYIKDYMMTPITRQMVDAAEEFAKEHGEPFNRDGFDIIVDEHNGFYPVEIEAVPEGTVMKSRNAQVQIINTDERLAWVVSFLETAMLRSVWYPSTVATQSREIKKVIANFMDNTAGHRNGLEFMLHDFGARGVSSSESAMIGGTAHLVNFMGSDTVEATLWAKAYYNEPMASFSVPAAEHSTMTSWGGADGEIDACRNMLEQFGEKYPIISVVSDSYDIYRCITDIWGGSLKEDVIRLGETGGRLVVRPDSGDPTVVPVECIKLLDEAFGHTVNARGYKVLPNYVRVLQGDGINIRSIRQILTNLMHAGYSAENIVFGMGGALLQGINRDTLKYAMKASARMTNGVWHDVYKEPVTDKVKNSKKGRLAVVPSTGIGNIGYRTIRKEHMSSFDTNMLRPVYKDGKILVDDTLSDIRKRAAI